MQKKQKIVQILGEEYIIPFPTMGQLQDIETFKISYTNGRYSDMVLSGIMTHNFALDAADALAYLGVLAPDLRTNLKIKNWKEIDPFTVKEIIHAYKKQFIPWFKPIIDDLYKYDEEEIIDGGDKQDTE